MAMETLPASDVRSAEAVLSRLRAEADHKASLRMYFSAAELLRSYCGPFAEQTQGERDRLALEYEALGTVAERERKEHGGAVVAIQQAPPVGSSWHCPACHTTLPADFVICGKCGLDLRTGKPYQAAASPPASSPRVPLSPLPTRKYQPLGHKAHRREDYTTLLVIAGVVAVLFALLVLLGYAARQPKPEPPPPRKGTWQW